MRLQDKVAIVTGAGRGIGRAIALRLAEDGANIVSSDIDGATAEDTAQQINKLGRKAIAVKTDVTRQNETRELAARCVAELGRIDILVNNAGIVQVKNWLELADEDIDRMFAVNIKSVIFCAQAVAPHLTAQRSGRVINIASLASKIGRPLYMHYAASKAAVVNITRAQAVYFAPFNVTANSICPGIVDTKMWELLDRELGAMEGLAPGEVLKQRIAGIPLGRVETPEDVAGVAAFLASDDSGYMTGQSLLVDGGIFME